MDIVNAAILAAFAEESPVSRQGTVTPAIRKWRRPQPLAAGPKDRIHDRRKTSDESKGKKAERLDRKPLVSRSIGRQKLTGPH
jgi:hypothetical protein